jgi:transposase
MHLRRSLQGFLPLGDKRTKVPVADVILLLLKNFLVSREPLYGIREWAAAHDPKSLGLTVNHVAALNDDRVGRCLAQLFDADQSSLALWVTTQVMREFDVSLDELHNDSTTVTFYGAYAGAEAGLRIRGKAVPAITFGHNKDHRPDLKQVLFALTTSSDGSVPVHFGCYDGNTTDDSTHIETWELVRALRGNPDFLYVADSKLATTENLGHIHREGGRFVSVLPRTRKEDQLFRELAEQDQIIWNILHRKYDDEGEVVDTYRIAEPEGSTAEGYRLLWIHSTRKAQLDLEARAKKIVKAQRELAVLRGKLLGPRTRWRDRAKLEAKVQGILSRTETTRWIRVETLATQEDRFRQEQPGRPGKNTKYRRRSRLRFDLEVRLDRDALAQRARTDGVFPLVTNDRELPQSEVLLAYKRQPFVEKRFSQFKSDFEVAPVFLKNPDRVQALLCVYYLALLAQALLEREVRLAMEKEGIESLPLYPEGRPCKRPCVRRTVDIFANVQRHVLEVEDQPPVTMTTKLTPLQKKLMRMLGVSESAFYMT